MYNIYRKKRRIEHESGSDERLDIESFEIGKHYHQCLAEVEKYLISRVDCHIGHGGDRMTDDINSHNKQNREERRDES